MRSHRCDALELYRCDLTLMRGVRNDTPAAKRCDLVLIRGVQNGARSPKRCAESETVRPHRRIFACHQVAMLGGQFASLLGTLKRTQVHGSIKDAPMHIRTAQSVRLRSSRSSETRR